MPTVSWRPSASTIRMIVTAAIFVALFLIVYGTSNFWVNWWWFGDIGYRSVLVTNYTAQIAAFLIAGILAAAFFLGNVSFALRRTRPEANRGAVARFGQRLLLGLVLAATVIVLFVAGSTAAARWETWLLWLNGNSFGVVEPTFNRDAGFYIFTVPALRLLQAGFTTLLIFTAIAVVLIYAVRLGVDLRDFRRIPDRMRIHVLALSGLFLLVLAAGYVLANYELVYSTRGAAFGPGYTDVNAQRIANWALAGITTLAAVLLILNAFVRRIRWLLATLVAWASLALVLGVVVPAIVQQVLVEPNEFRRESPFIERNIEMTRAAYDLDEVEMRELSGQDELDIAALEAQPETINNIRLWDYRVIQPTYQQVQTFVPYYHFHDVDVDRYQVNGEIVQVVTSARELNFDGLPETAQTWINRRLAYTHGTGVVVSPVSGVTQTGQPQFLVGNIPPTGSGPFEIERPEIYYGETTNDWVAVYSEQEEFGGIAEGATAVPADPYAGEARGSIQLSNFLSRAIMATYLGDRRIMISGELTNESRIMLRRSISERVQEIAPFLTYDPDPYIVIADGQLYWIIDAYTTSDRFPQATPTRGINYMRNSVKVVIDAYDGTTTFYRTESDDPIADAYGDIYSDLFTPVAEAPPSIAAHFRYPELLFNIQSEVYGTFHVQNPRALYDGDDRWQVAEEQFEGTVQRMEPYYVTMTLPREEEADFTLIVPFTPAGRDQRQNMTAWMAGRTDEAGNLRLVTYRFPRQVTVFGPRQIESRINQEPDISAQISLWDRADSTVIRGNLLVIPVGDSLMYVQPLYLRAAGATAALPEMQRVIIATAERVVMRPTLEEAIEAVTVGAAPIDEIVDDIEAPPEADPDAEPAVPDPDAEPAEPDVSPDLAQQALAAYERAQEALQRGDWEAYGQEQANLEAALRELISEVDEIDDQDELDLVEAEAEEPPEDE